ERAALGRADRAGARVAACRRRRGGRWAADLRRRRRRGPGRLRRARDGDGGPRPAPGPLAQPAARRALHLGRHGARGPARRAGSGQRPARADPLPGLAPGRALGRGGDSDAAPAPVAALPVLPRPDGALRPDRRRPGGRAHRDQRGRRRGAVRPGHPPLRHRRRTRGRRPADHPGRSLAADRRGPDPDGDRAGRRHGLRLPRGPAHRSAAGRPRVHRPPPRRRRADPPAPGGAPAAGRGLGGRGVRLARGLHRRLRPAGAAASPRSRRRADDRPAQRLCHRRGPAAPRARGHRHAPVGRAAAGERRAL
ncbi:MAG: putative aldose-1-epimerase, partial [uncultured Frankineae bacterium]